MNSTVDDDDFSKKIR